MITWVPGNPQMKHGEDGGRQYRQESEQCKSEMHTQPGHGKFLFPNNLSHGRREIILKTFENTKHA